jgi:hypothetical protein
MVIDQSTSGSATFKVKTQCKKTLAKGKSCKASVTFKPTDTTPQMGELIVDDNASMSPQMVPLTGTGK